MVDGSVAQAVEQNGRGDIGGPAVRQGHGEGSAKGEANHAHRSRCRLVELPQIRRCSADLLHRSQRVQRITQPRGILDGGGNVAVIEIGRQHDESMAG